MDLAFLFISALAASTILPMSSEAVLGMLARSGSSEVWLLLAVATAGNTLGAVVNWGIGRYAATWRTRLLSLDDAQFERACRWFNRWGIWCLLLSLTCPQDSVTQVESSGCSWCPWWCWLSSHQGHAPGEMRQILRA